MAKNRRRLFGRGGSKRSNKSSEQPERRGSILSRRGKGSKKRNSLYTKGGEYTLEGKNYVGDYHIMEDGTPMTGKSHRGRGLFGLRSKKKRSKTLVPVPDVADTSTDTTDTTDTTTTTDTTAPIEIPPPPPPPPPPPRVDLSGIINQPYKPLANYGNQYPATDSSVRDAQNTNITSYYSGGTVRGHLGSSRKIAGDSVVLGAQAHSQLSIDFIINLDGTAYTSSQMLGKISKAKSEGNWYYINSVPVINVSTSEIRPYKADLFKTEEDYAFNTPTNQIDSLDELMATIDWTVRKQAQLEQPRAYSDRYDSKDGVAGRLDIDAVIASANKPPKIRWRQS